MVGLAGRMVRAALDAFVNADPDAANAVCAQDDRMDHLNRDVIAELIGEKSGLTDFIVTQGGKYNFDRVFPVIIMIGVIGFVTDQILQVLAKKLFPWEYTKSSKGFFVLLREALTRAFRKPKTAAKEAAHV